MAYRKISLPDKIAIFVYIFSRLNKTQIAKKFMVDPNTIIYLINKKLIPALEIILADEKPGPKVNNNQIELDFSKQSNASKSQDGRPEFCPSCGSTKVWKNGFYYVFNWLLLLLPFATINLKEKIQRFICGNCKCPIPSEKKEMMTAKREDGKILIKRFIVFSKFKLRLSHRLIESLIHFIFPNFTLSIRHIDLVTQQIGARSRDILDGIKDLPQKVAKVIMGDETFPKIIGKGLFYGKSLAVVICECGVIRSVKVVRKKSRNLKSIFQSAIGTAFNPKYFLSDYDKNYPKVIKEINKDFILLKDLVHTMRIIFRHIETAIRNIKIDYPKTLSIKERKKQKKLKQRLVRKHLKRIKYIFFKAFDHGRESVAHVYLYGALNELKNFPFQNEAIKKAYNALKKFINKYIDTLVFQLENRDEIVSTTNALESKNSILKAFSRVAKSYQKADTCEKTFNGIALMENFDIKTRGVNQGTSAFSRADVQLGADNFFDCVGLTLKK